jgi:hypothetical protein
MLFLLLLLLFVLLATRPRPARNMPTTSARPARDPPATRLRSARPASRPQRAPNKSRKKISRFARLADNPPANPGPRPARNAPQNAPQTIVAKKNSRFARLASQPLPAAHLKSNFPQTIFLCCCRFRDPPAIARPASRPQRAQICFALRATRRQPACNLFCASRSPANDPPASRLGPARDPLRTGAPHSYRLWPGCVVMFIGVVTVVIVHCPLSLLLLS